MRETLRECREHARRLAVALHDKHYPEVTQWRPLDDLLGIIDQIDNMTTGLTRHPAPLMSEDLVARLNRRIFALRGLSSTAEARPFCDSDGDWGLIEFASDVRELLTALSTTQESNR